MFILKDAYTNMTMKFETLYQISKYFYDNGIANNKTNYVYLKKGIKNKKSVYKHYYIFEIPDEK